MLKKWQAKYQYCPRCREKLEVKGNRAYCPACKFETYYNPGPCVTVMIVRDNPENPNIKQVLLTKRGIEPLKGEWDSPGGFIEGGENGIDAALRETKEETNLEVEITDYLGSVADYYVDHDTISLCYEAKIISGTPKAMDDAADLEWFDLDKTPSGIAFISTSTALDKIKQKYL